MDEGETVLLDHVATDADVPAQLLSFSLGAGSRIGAVVNAATGRITWPTTELNGAGTNDFSVIVRDSGQPQLSATGQVQVIVREVNSAPTLAPIANVTINEGQLLSVTNVAADHDLPANKLAFSLGAGAPAGTAINPTNDLFTWQPTSTQGSSTNPITMIAADHGLPPPGATQQVIIIVRDSLSDLSLGLGATNLFAGESNSVGVSLSCTLDVINLTFQIGAPTNRLDRLGLRPSAVEVVSVTCSRSAPTAMAQISL